MGPRLNQLQETVCELHMTENALGPTQS